MRKSKIATWLILLLIPLTIAFGNKLPGRSYYLTSTLILLEIMLPFFLAFEGRKPQARELVVIAVLCALAIAGRVVIPIPNFKATYAIIMLSAVAFGPESGFLIGAMTALVSNFFFGQGPHTPWQMMAYGMGGFLAGLLFYGRERTNPRLDMVMKTAFGFFAVVLAVGPLLDACTVFTTGATPTWKFALAVFTAGFPII